jgi:hypothetical protein
VCVCSCACTDQIKHVEIYGGHSGRRVDAALKGNSLKFSLTIEKQQFCFEREVCFDNVHARRHTHTHTHTHTLTHTLVTVICVRASADLGLV